LICTCFSELKKLRFLLAGVATERALKAVRNRIAATAREVAEI
jgi:hypothetical protein